MISNRKPCVCILLNMREWARLTGSVRVKINGLEIENKI